MCSTSWVPALLGLLLTTPGCKNRDEPPRTEAPLRVEAPPPEPKPRPVDLGVQELEYQSIASVTARAKEDWWAVVDAWPHDEALQKGPPFQVMRSADAGRSWREDRELTAALGQVITDNKSRPKLFVWYTPDIGVIAGDLGARVLRTTDAGRTWTSVPLSEALSVHDVARAGGRTWACGSTGGIHRSDDAGASWRELALPPFSVHDPCVSMSFLDPERGWALGRKGNLWQTHDGGEHWARLKAPIPPMVQRHPVLPPEPEKLRKVVRVTREVAWVAGESSRFQTTDGAQAWHARPLPSELRQAGPRIVMTPDGQQVIVVGRSTGAPATWVPAVNAEAVAMGDDAVVMLEQRKDDEEDLGESGLHTYVAGQLVWAGPLRSAGSGVLTPLDGVAGRSPQSWLGWSGEHAVATFDAGRSWVKVGRLPESPVQKLVFLKAGTALARTAAGTLLRSEARDFGRKWEATTDALDAYDFAVKTGATVGAPFECVLSTAPATLHIEFGVQGCFTAAPHTLTLELAQEGATLTGGRSRGAPSEMKPLEPRNLSRAEAERIVRELAAAATPEEVPGGCVSTNTFVVVMEWSCPSSTTKKGGLELRAHDCALPDGMSGYRPNSYPRAFHTYEVASRVLKNGPR